MATVEMELTQQIRQSFVRRNAVFECFFEREAQTLARACREMSERFLNGGRLLALGRGPYITDAQHVSVEFVHPVIVGKRALPALELSPIFSPWLRALVQPEDIVMGFGPPEGDLEIQAILDFAGSRGAMTFALPGDTASYSLKPPVTDPFLHQELIEILYHTLWETVHVFFEHRELGHDAGNAAFLYPFLSNEKQETQGLLDQVVNSIRSKAKEDSKLRDQVAEEEAHKIAAAAQAIAEHVLRGGKLILFGNGGSATDANDWAIDCFDPPKGYAPIPAISLSMEPAIITALANDVGADVIFLRQLLAHARPNDVAIGISTSGGSKNVILALEAAHKQGLTTVALLGYDGGEILRRKLADYPLIVSSDYIPRIQEVQASIYHCIRYFVETIIHAVH